jgi:heparan-alpha-glucosaminide N-acetyltransferase
MVKLRDNNTDAAARPDKIERLACLDAVRGFFLLILVSAGFGLRDAQQEMLSPERWGWIINQFKHRDVPGCSLWDLLLPALLFCAGIAMPISYTNRQSKGQSWFRQFAHAFLRAAVLVALGIYLDSYRQDRLLFDLRGNLQMIGLAYLLAFLVVPLGMPAQGVTVGFLLVGSTAGYVIYAFAGGHDLWSPTQNLGVALDQWLGFGPHPEKYVTFNVFSWAAVVLLGVLVGGLIRTGLTPGAKIAIMTGSSIFALLFGWVLGGGNGWIEFSWYAVIPMIKPIATWTFVFTAVGWTLLVFTYFYLITDGFALRAWALPLTLVGRNPLALYVSYQLFHGWAEKSAKLVLPGSPPTGAMLKPLFASLIVLAIYWLLCFWLYRRRIFFKV